jgi:hypothetical protein
MSTQQQFYTDRANEARRDADAATLDNVRERCLRSEAAWTEMAARAGRTERMRIKSDAQKLAARAGQEPSEAGAAGSPELIP